MPRVVSNGFERRSLLDRVSLKVRLASVQVMAPMTLTPASALATGLRFNPPGRPDTLFTEATLRVKSIKLLNHCQQTKCPTLADEIIEGLIRTLDHVPRQRSGWHNHATSPCWGGVATVRVDNISKERSAELVRYIEVLDQCLGQNATMEMLPQQAVVVPYTAANMSTLFAVIEYRPTARAWSTAYARKSSDIAIISEANYDD